MNENTTLAALLRAMEAANRLTGTGESITLQTNSGSVAVDLSPLEKRLFLVMRAATVNRLSGLRMDAQTMSAFNAMTLVAGLTELFKAVDES